MGHIKEPKGVDFVISSDPLTEKDRQEISKFIRNYKINISNKKAKATKVSKQRKVVQA
jgi:hypothetical protein